MGFFDEAVQVLEEGWNTVNSAWDSIQGEIGPRLTDGWTYINLADGGFTRYLRDNREAVAPIAIAATAYYCPACLPAVMAFVNSGVLSDKGGLDTPIAGVGKTILQILEPIFQTTTNNKEYFRTQQLYFKKTFRPYFETSDNILRSTTTSLLNGITGAVVSNRDLISRTIQEATIGQTQALVDSNALNRRLLDSVLKSIGDKITSSVELLRRTNSGAMHSIEKVLWEVNDVLSTQTNTVSQSIRQLQTVTGGAVEIVSEKIGNINAAIRLAQDAQAAVMRELFGGKIDALPSAFWDKLNDIAEPGLRAFSDDFENIPIAGQDPDRPLCLTREEWREFMNTITPQSGLGKALWAVISAAFLLWNTAGTLSQVQAATLIQEFAVECPYQLLAQPDVIQAWHRGLIDEDTARLTLQKQGLSDSDATTLMRAASALPDETTLAAMWLRGLISGPAFEGAMKARGWNDFWVDRTKELVFFVPPPADLVMMAVREVFDVPTATAQGQFADFPEDFALYASQQGISREWAERYWAAHWGLPSVQMGYEMLHRGVITQPELEGLMRAQDIMPGWRQPLVDISYSPYTRVDIRRMHGLGLLTEAEVDRAYRDLGYDAAKAANMTAFTLELNRPDPPDPPNELKEATRSNVISFFKDGIIDELAAVRLLLDMEYSPQAVSLYIIQAKLDVDAAERQAEKKAVIAQARSGQLSYDQAQDRLTGLGLTSDETAKVLADLSRQLADKPRLPSLEHLGKMLAAALITNGEFVETVQLKGYSEKWANHYLILAGGTLGGDTATG